MGLKTFFLVFFLMRSYSSTIIFDFDIEKSHKELNERINEAIIPLGLKGTIIPNEYSYMIFALSASILSYSIVRTTVKFAYYFFMFTIDSQE